MKRYLLLLTAIPLFTTSAVADITLSVGDAQGPPDSEVVVPIEISGSKKVGPLQFILDYDRKILTPIEDDPDEEPRGVVFGEVVDGGMIATNTSSPGELRIALRTDQPITKDGRLLEVRFLVKGERGETATLLIHTAEAWEKESLHEVVVTTEPGTVEVGGFALPLSIPWLIAIGVGCLILLLGCVAYFRRRRRRGAVAPPAPQARPAAAPTNVAPTAAFCSQCGAQAAEGKKFCSQCGSPLSA